MLTIENAATYKTNAQIITINSLINDFLTNLISYLSFSAKYNKNSIIFPST